MRAFLKLVLALVLIGTGLAIFAYGMRYHDGPLAIFPGGPFKTGAVAASPTDWSFLTDREEIEFQTLEPAQSRVVWVAVVDQRAYLVSGYMTTFVAPYWKQWPHYIKEDDRVTLRVDGKLYEQRLKRLLGHPQLAQIVTAFANKYGFADQLPEDPGDVVRSGSTWLYEVLPR